MHSRGVIGAQFLHSASSDLSIPAKSRLFSAFRVGSKTLPICLFSVWCCFMTGEGVRGWCKTAFFGDWWPLMTRVINYDDRHI